MRSDQYRAECRAELLRVNTGRINPLTGEALPPLTLPRAPVKDFVDPHESRRAAAPAPFATSASSSSSFSSSSSAIGSSRAPRSAPPPPSGLARSSNALGTPSTSARSAAYQTNGSTFSFAEM